MNRWIRFRIGLAYLSILIFLSLIVFRLIQLQVLKSPALEQLASKQFQKISKTSPYRLPIYDRNEEELAVSIPASSIFARPKLIGRKRYTAHVLSKVLGGTRSRWLSKLKSERSFIWIERQAKESIAKELSKYKLPGVFVESENKRLYPNGALAAHILGFTDIDGNGLAGTELSFNDELLQRSTQLMTPRDGKGNPSYIDPSKPLAGPTQGGVYLTIDRRVQHILEDELELSLQQTNAKAALAIVMDPRNGEILALGQRPTFDPNRASEADTNALTNRLVSHLYEPGSTLKTFFIGETLQLGLLDESTLIDCENGELRVADRVIHEAESDHQFDQLPVGDVLAFSSNIGAVKIAQYLGIERVRDVLDKFGFTEKTGIRLPAEATSSAKNSSFWNPVALANVAFGQGISISPIQLVAAYATIANGGYRVRPKIVLGETQNKSTSYEGQRVLSPNTVATLRTLLTNVVEKKGGTGNPAAIPGIRVAGKTGTGQKYYAGEGYRGGKYFSSFVGFLPVEKPELIVAVMVDEPKWPYYATLVAAPLFKKISERSLHVLGRVPKIVLAKNEGPHANHQDRPTVPAPNKLDVIQGKMPNFSGKNIRDVLAVTQSYFKQVRIQGSGYLVAQVPPPGAEVNSNVAVTLTFSPEG